MNVKTWVVGLAVVAMPMTGVAETSPHTVGANFGVVSDYVARGFEMSWGEPAVQGGVDYSHASGFYVSTWMSSVSSSLVANGNVEVDFYTGYSLAVSDDLTGEVGVAYYWYPDAGYGQFMLNDANYPGQDYCGAEDVCNAGLPDNTYDTAEAYIGLNYGPFSGKVLYTLTNYYGYDDKTAGIMVWPSGITGGVETGKDTKGSVYVDLNGNFSITDQFTATAHAGYQHVANSQNLSYYDFKLGVNYAFGQGWNAGLVWVDTLEAEIYDNFPAVDGTGELRGVTEGRAIASISRTL